MPINRQDVIDYEQFHQCGEPRFKQLLVRCPIAIIEMTPHLDLFSTQAFDSTDTADYLYLRLFPQYTQENDVVGEGVLKNTFNSAAVYGHSTVRRGFVANVSDRRLIILDILRKLVLISRTSSYSQFTPIKVIDFCLPEYSESYTVRFGAINIDNLPGIMGEYLKQDWSFTFKEAKLRDI